ncbi:hypothetical protein SAMN05443575_2948 [Jatrophihabitans endophyticus]|uniref:Uncharacterized protein n=1 Tax=Jatrophihabitans endophyticus TaxID=1206085 RepID=A0A1M5N9S0_9ACTN|nr:hypothetical protein [Jatrophihabitans endophyticus]SHG85949.1 hypothetical protein SAMN05443575_2948 [Jatrophihabitans endophyticus]
MPELRSGPFAAWTRAWLAGQASPDDVLAAVTGDDAPHRVESADGDPRVTGLGTLLDLLAACRREDAPPRLVLPAAGDVRGVPGPAPFRAAALEAGEAVVCGRLGAVPDVVEYHPSSAPATVTWLVHVVEALPPDHQSVPDAQYELTTAIRESASVLAAADVGRWRDEIADLLHDARRAGERLVLPRGYPARAVALLAQAERMHAVLELAAGDPVGGAVDQHGIGIRAGALRPLATAVRRARVTAYNATAAD